MVIYLRRADLHKQSAVSVMTGYFSKSKSRLPNGAHDRSVNHQRWLFFYSDAHKLLFVGILRVWVNSMWPESHAIKIFYNWMVPWILMLNISPTWVYSILKQDADSHSVHNWPENQVWMNEPCQMHPTKYAKWFWVFTKTIIPSDPWVLIASLCHNLVLRSKTLCVIKSPMWRKIALWARA